MKNVAEDFKYGKNIQIGQYVIIEQDVIVGDNVKIGHRVTLKPGTRIGNNSIIDDHCITTGACYVGNNVNIRTGAIISKSTIIEDYCFIGPGVITNHTKNVTHGRQTKIMDQQLLTYIGYGSIIGSQASVLAGIYIGPQSIVGGGSVLVKDLEGYGVYVGSPCRKKAELPPEYKLSTEPKTAGEMYLSEEILGLMKKYMPNLKLRKT